MSPALVQRLTARDAAWLRQLRLDALVQAPESFGSSYEEEHTLTLEDIRERISPGDDGAMFGAYVEDTLAGMVGVGRQRKLKMRHKAHIWSLYVAPPHRGHGLARLLMQAAIVHARTMRGIRQVQLSVTASNTAATALYASLGFKIYGLEPEALCVNGALHDEALMALPLPGQ